MDVSVSLEGDAVVRVDAGEPEVTIVSPTDPTDITVISPEPADVIITDEHPEVVINYDFSTDIGKTALITLLTDSLGVDQLSPALANDITLLQDLWLRVGDDVEQLLIDADVSSITQIATDYTDTQIQTIAVDISRIDDAILANTSSITQTATEINSRVTTLETDTDDNFTAQSSRIDQTAVDIALNVSRMDSIDSDIAAANASIVLNADGITAEVTAREALASGAVAENTTRSTQTADALVDIVTAANSLEGRVDTAESTLTAQGATLTVLTESVEEGLYSLQTTQSITAGTYGVTIAETVGGIPYVSGFELVLHPTWTVGSPGFGFRYVVDDVVTYTPDGRVYKCILDHVATVDNSPGSAAMTTYWVLEADSAQTEFNIQADSFSVITPGGLVPLLNVDGGTGAVSINGDLVIGGSLQSSNYGTAGESYYKLDHATGSAEFNDITMSFTTSGKTAAQTALNVSDGAQPVTVTTIAAAMISTPLVVTNRITDNAVLASAKLDLNFTTGVMTVNNTNGLVIASANGMIINSTGVGLTIGAAADIELTAGGDIILGGSSGDTSQLQFQYDGDDIGYMSSYQNGVTIQATKALSYFSVSNFEGITMYCDSDHSLGSFGEDDSGLVRMSNGASWGDILLQATSYNTTYLYSTIEVKSHATDANERYIELNNDGHVVKMVDGYEIHKGLIKTTETAARTKAATLANGEFLFYVGSDDSYHPRCVYRDTSGNLQATRLA